MSHLHCSNDKFHSVLLISIWDDEPIEQNEQEQEQEQEKTQQRKKTNTVPNDVMPCTTHARYYLILLLRKVSTFLDCFLFFCCCLLEGFCPFLLPICKANASNLLGVPLPLHSCTWQRGMRLKIDRLVPFSCGQKSSISRNQRTTHYALTVCILGWVR